MFEHHNLTKTEFLTRNISELDALIADVNRDLASRHGAALQPLTRDEFWLVFYAEAAIDRNGHIDIDGRHSLGERGVLPLPSNIAFWNGPGAPNPKQPHSLTQNLTHYALYLGQLKNKVVRTRGGREIYPGLFRHPGIAGDNIRMAKVLAGVVHGYFFGGNYRPGPPPDTDLLNGFAQDHSIADMLRGTTYVHAGTSILENRKRNIDEAVALILAQGPSPNAMAGEASEIDGRYALVPEDTFGLATAIMRLDVDGPTALNYVSFEVTRGFPRELTHVVAQVVDSRMDGGSRWIRAIPIYQAGEEWLLNGDEITLELPGAARAHVEFRRSGTVIARLQLVRESSFFDKVEFEVDVVENAGRVHDVYDPHSHPNRPATLPANAVSIERSYRDAGFDVSMSSERSTIPLADAGSNGTWSDAELHNAMQKFWSRFDNRAQWGMWVVYAALHDDGDSLGGIMFDSIGSNHRQGTAIFTNSFISRAPLHDSNPEAWRRRMQMWTAVHEVGHGFNMAHSWQKEVGAAFPLTAQDEPAARSFMNYPYNVSGGQEAFFSDFEFRFSNRELLFMRHAPRHFVRMGAANWGSNHGLHAPKAEPDQPFRLEIRPNRKRNVFDFLEPVHMELKLSNVSAQRQSVPQDVLSDGHYVAIAVARDGADRTRRHRPFMTACRSPRTTEVEPGDALYATHFVGASTGGWLIDEPGFYTIQAAISMKDQTVLSNALRIYVHPGNSVDAHILAPDFFDEDVGRALAFKGVPELDNATNVLREIVDRLPSAPVAQHARLSLASPMVRQFKHLKISEDTREVSIASSDPDLDTALELQSPILKTYASQTAETLGHIQYRTCVENLARSLAQNGAVEEAADVQGKLVDTLEERKILPSVIRDSRNTLGIYTGAVQGA